MATASMETDTDLHEDLMVKLGNELLQEEFNVLKSTIKTRRDLPINALEKYDTFLDLWHALESRKLIKIGEYEYLVKRFEIMRKLTCNDIIQETVEKIKELRATKAQFPCASTGDDSHANRSSDQSVFEVPGTSNELGSAVYLENNKQQKFACDAGDGEVRENQLKKLDNVSFPIGSPCKSVWQIKHRANRRLAALGATTRDAPEANTIYFQKEVSPQLTGEIKKGVYPAWDMAVLSTGDLVVARQDKPPIRVFNPDTGTTRDINITNDGKAIDVLMYVETDENDNMFVLNDYRNPLLFVVNSNGNVIQRVRLDGCAHRMAFCSLKRILYITTYSSIRRVHWSDNVLEEISLVPHYVAGFKCWDVCIGSRGEVFVSGWENDDIVIYQVTEKKDEDDFVWRELTYQDGVERRSSRCYPHVCARDDNLWLGYKDKIERFQLV